MIDTRWQCDNCDWRGTIKEMLTAPNPFKPDESVMGCPMCKEVELFTNICDEPGCDQKAGCGWPSPNGYRTTCFKHSPYGKTRA